MHVLRTGLRAAKQTGTKTNLTVPLDGVNANVARDDWRTQELTILFVVVHVPAKLLHTHTHTHTHTLVPHTFTITSEFMYDVAPLTILDIGAEQKKMT